MTIYWDDECEDGTTRFQNMYDDAENVSCNGGPIHCTYNQTDQVSGAGCMQYNFQDTDPDDHICEYGGGNYYNFTETDDCYFRFYFRMVSGWQASSTAPSKLIGVFPNTGNFVGPSIWIVMFNDKRIILWYQSPSSHPGENVKFQFDSGHALSNHDQWYCIELRSVMNTVGLENGVTQAWLDGDPVTLTDIQFGENPAAWEMRGNSSHHLGSVAMFKQWGSGATLLDRIAVANERIGAIGGGGSIVKQARHHYAMMQS